jgi:putative copper export protein
MGAASVQLALEGTAKAVTYAAVLVATGTSVVRWSMLRRLDASSYLGDPLERRLLTIAAMAAVVLVASLVTRAWTHTVSVFGLSDAWSWQNLRLIVVRSRWGSGWRVQLGLALGLVAATQWARRDRHTGWMAIAAVCTGVCYSLPLVGHAAGSGWRLLLHGSHILAAGAWLGTLTVLLILGRWKVEAGQMAERDAVIASWLGGFASTAVAGAATLTVAGAIAAWLYLGSIAALWSTVYGRTLGAKLLLFVGAAGCGYVNWRGLHRRSRVRREGVAADARDRAPAIGLEVTLAALVILITAVLTELEHPH